MDAIDLRIISEPNSNSKHVQVLINGNDCGYLYLTSEEYKFVVSSFKLSEDNLRCVFRHDEDEF